MEIEVLPRNVVCFFADIFGARDVIWYRLECLCIYKYNIFILHYVYVSLKNQLLVWLKFEQINGAIKRDV